jgi:hypothetical protein
MKPHQSLAKHLKRALCVATLAVASSTSMAWAQTPGPDSVGPFRFVTELPGGARAIGHDVAVVEEQVPDGTVLRVFERRTGEPDGERWDDVGTLSPSDGGAGFGQSVATDGTTIVVGASGAAYVFERDTGSGMWQEVARLTSEVNTESFGESVSVSGTTVVVGAAFPDGPLVPRQGRGFVFVFERNDSSTGWIETARLDSGCDPAPQPGPGPCLQFDLFGRAVSLDGDTLVVGANPPFIAARPVTDAALAHIFSRREGTSNGWIREAILREGIGLDAHISAPRVSISGDTIVFAASLFNSFIGRFHARARIYQRDYGGSDAWGCVTALAVDEGQLFCPPGLPPGLPPASLPGVRTVSISGDLAIMNGEDNVAYLFARNQGGADAWEEAAQLPGDAFISGDTVLAGSPASVYVLDIDRDGLRDGSDPCPRDPLNNVAGGCARDSGAYLLLDNLVTLGAVEIESSGQPYVIRATFTNSSGSGIINPFFEVTELSGGNRLLNGDAGAGDLGATLSPDVGDGILSPGESMTVRFVIQLETREPFRFFVTIRGDTDQ